MTTSIKLSEILNKSKSQILFNLHATDSSKLISNTQGNYSVALSTYCKKFINPQAGDEVVKIGSKEQNISEIKRSILFMSKSPIYIHFLGDDTAFEGIIEIDC